MEATVLAQIKRPMNGRSNGLVYLLVGVPGWIPEIFFVVPKGVTPPPSTFVFFSRSSLE